MNKYLLFYFKELNFFVINTFHIKYFKIEIN
jgi:hypothetical protein